MYVSALLKDLTLERKIISGCHANALKIGKRKRHQKAFQVEDIHMYNTITIIRTVFY